MTSETRYFGSPLNQSFTLSYDYNLAGELKKITDPTNMTINYGFDSSGRKNPGNHECSEMGTNDSADSAG